MMMKQILLLTILVLTFCLQIFGQDKPECPNLEVAVVRKDSSILFYISSVKIFDNSKFEYKWTVSNGVNFKGQNTSVISIPIDKNLAGQTITATLEIKGLPEGCNTVFTKSAEMVSQQIIDPIIRDKLLGKANWNDVIARLINLSLAINNEQGSKAKVIFRVSNNSERNWATSQQKKILKSLKRVNIPKDRILMEIQKTEFFETEFIFIPPPKN